MNTLTAAVDAPRSGIASAKRELPCRFALGSLSASMLLSSLGTSLPNVGLPTLARDFGASFQGVQWIVLAYLLSITSLIVVAGRLGDLAGRRRVLLWRSSRPLRHWAPWRPRLAG
jgi:MFS family permease